VGASCLVWFVVVLYRSHGFFFDPFYFFTTRPIPSLRPPAPSRLHLHLYEPTLFNGQRGVHIDFTPDNRTESVWRRVDLRPSYEPPMQWSSPILTISTRVSRLHCISGCNVRGGYRTHTGPFASSCGRHTRPVSLVHVRSNHSPFL
jgi:hypothetical protein